MSYLTFHSKKIFYKEAGHGKPLVMLHGDTALKRPDLTEKVIADSFDGRTLHETFAEDLLKERRTAMQDPSARQFYQWCQGEDWGSREDTMCRRNMEEEYLEMSRLVQDGSIHMFQTGGHPSILTNAELSARVITEFIYG